LGSELENSLLDAKQDYTINPVGVLTVGLVLFWGIAAALLWRLL